jgi:hypothetical protein
MKQDEVLQTLRKVIKESECYTTWTVSTPHLVELVKRAVEAEREACAKLCDWYVDSSSDHEAGTAMNIQDAIRARGQA